MSARTTSSGEVAMVYLRSFLERAGYRRLYPVLGDGGLLVAEIGRATKRLSSLDPDHAALLALFALGREVETAALGAELVEVLGELGRAGLATDEGGQARTSGWIVVPALGGLLLTGIPPTYAVQAGVGASAYLGRDSLRLAAALPDARGRRVLDVGTGCGIQGLLAASGAESAVLTDIEVRSLEIAALNRALNATAHPVELRLGDCYEPVEGEQFDLVIALPPYVPEVESSGTRSTVASGPDGMGVLRRLLAGARTHLTPGGELVARCQLLCDDDGPLLDKELAELTSGLKTTVVLSDGHALQPYVVELATSLASHGSPASARELVELYGRSLRGLGATSVCTALIHARRPAATTGHDDDDGGGSSVRMIGRAQPVARGTTPRPGADLHVAHDPQSRIATVPGAAPVLLDGPSSALLAAVDGGRGVEELVERAWGSPQGAARADLVDQALARLEQLERSGLVRLD